VNKATGSRQWVWDFAFHGISCKTTGFRETFHGMTGWRKEEEHIPAPHSTTPTANAHAAH
jgi:hypothetical protein